MNATRPVTKVRGPPDWVIKLKMVEITSRIATFTLDKSVRACLYEHRACQYVDSQEENQRRGNPRTTWAPHPAPRDPREKSEPAGCI